MSTVVHVDPDMSDEQMVRVFNRQVSEDGTLAEAMKSVRHISKSQERHQANREFEYKKSRGLID